MDFKIWLLGFGIVIIASIISRLAPEGKKMEIMAEITVALWVVAFVALYVF